MTKATDSPVSRASAQWGDSPAVLVVDISRKRADPNLETSYPSIVDAAERTSSLLEVARDLDVPVCYSRGGRSYYTSDGVDLTDAQRGGWPKQNPIREESREEAERAITVAPTVEPEPGDLTVTKIGPSAFFWTELPVYLSSIGVDTLIVTGIMTSSCVRATVTDAFAYDYWVVVPRECVADRRTDAHRYHVDEMDQKYADVTAVTTVIEYLRATNSGRPNRSG